MNRTATGEMTRPAYCTKRVSVRCMWKGEGDKYHAPGKWQTEFSFLDTFYGHIGSQVQLSLPRKGKTSVPALVTSRVGWVLPPPPPSPAFSPEPEVRNGKMGGEGGVERTNTKRIENSRHSSAF
jgi:hypothetical protein